MLQLPKIPRAQIVEVEIDPRDLALTEERQRSDINKFSRLLDIEADEQRIHKFLANHSYFFNRLIRLNGKSPLYSKVRLGNDYEVDFAFFDSGSVGPEWHLVEIERATVSLFTRSGNPSAALTHAIQQIQNWQSWVHDNLDYARQLMPLIEYPLGCIFMGRRSDITQDDQKRLRHLLYTHRQSLEIHTLDWFIDSARSVWREGWRIPNKALSHSDLKRGLPEEARRYIRLFTKGG